MFVCLFVYLFAGFCCFVIVFLLAFLFFAPLLHAPLFIHLHCGLYFCPVFFVCCCSQSHSLSISWPFHLVFSLSTYILFYLPCCCWFLYEHSVEIYIAHIGIIITLIWTVVLFVVVSLASVVYTVYTFVHVGRKTIVLSTLNSTQWRIYMYISTFAGLMTT